FLRGGGSCATASRGAALRLSDAVAGVRGLRGGGAVGGGETGARLRGRAGAGGLGDRRGAASRSLGHARLVEALAKPGCPVCRSVRDDSLRHLGTVLYEHVTDPGIRAGLRASRGFCSWHAALLAELPDSAFGVSIIAGDIL